MKIHKKKTKAFSIIEILGFLCIGAGITMFTLPKIEDLKNIHLDAKETHIMINLEKAKNALDEDGKQVEKEKFNEANDQNRLERLLPFLGESSIENLTEGTPITKITVNELGKDVTFEVNRKNNENNANTESDLGEILQ